MPLDGFEARLNDQAIETLRAALGEPRLRELCAQGATLEPADAHDAATRLATDILGTADVPLAANGKPDSQPHNPPNAQPVLRRNTPNRPQAQRRHAHEHHPEA